MKNAIVVVMLTCCMQVHAQSSKKEAPLYSSLKAGAGVGMLGSGDILVWTGSLDYERQLNRYFTHSFSLFGANGGERLNRYLSGISSDIAAINANIFLSPFTNQHVYNLKIGTGLSYMRVHDHWTVTGVYGGKPEHYKTGEIRSSLGYNMIIENEFHLGRNLLALQFMVQPYFNYDINSSVMIKYGRTLR